MHAHRMVRTDCREQKLDAFLKPVPSMSISVSGEGESDLETANGYGMFLNLFIKYSL